MGGNLCGVSTGEALSRWCAAVIGNNALSDFATAPEWAQDAIPDFVNKTDPTDQNPDSTGCGMAFISWLLSQGFTLDKIAQKIVSLKDAGTLAQLYAGLTSKPASKALPAFLAAVKALKGGVTSDDPFGTGVQSGQITPVTPLTAALAGKIFSSIVTDVAAGKPAHHIVASVQKFLGPAPRLPNQHPKKRRKSRR
jgi:hypothetical protein